MVIVTEFPWDGYIIVKPPCTCHARMARDIMYAIIRRCLREDVLDRPEFDLKPEGNFETRMYNGYMWTLNNVETYNELLEAVHDKPPKKLRPFVNKWYSNILEYRTNENTIYVEARYDGRNRKTRVQLSTVRPSQVMEKVKFRAKDDDLVDILKGNFVPENRTDLIVNGRRVHINDWELERLEDGDGPRVAIHKEYLRARRSVARDKIRSTLRNHQFRKQLRREEDEERRLGPNGVRARDLERDRARVARRIATRPRLANHEEWLADQRRRTQQDSPSSSSKRKSPVNTPGEEDDDSDSTNYVRPPKRVYPVRRRRDYDEIIDPSERRRIEQIARNRTGK